VRLLLAIFLLLITPSATAERRTVSLPQMPQLGYLVRSSGMIFSGVVLLVQPSGQALCKLPFEWKTQFSVSAVARLSESASGVACGHLASDT
jgi:hypothetical protein